MAQKSRPVGFYYLILGGVILGLFAGCIIVGLVLASDWISEALHYDVLTRSTASILVALGIAAFLALLARDPLRRKNT